MYEVEVPMSVFLDQLAESNHYAVLLEYKSNEKSLEKLRFFVSPSTANNIPQIIKLLNATLGARDQDAEWEGYLVVVSAGPEVWNGLTVKVDAGAFAAIRHSRVGMDDGQILMVVLRNSVLTTQSRQFEKRLAKDSIKIVLTQTTCHQQISHQLERIKVGEMLLYLLLRKSTALIPVLGGPRMIRAILE